MSKIKKFILLLTIASLPILSWAKDTYDAVQKDSYMVIGMISAFVFIFGLIVLLMPFFGTSEGYEDFELEMDLGSEGSMPIEFGRYRKTIIVEALSKDVIQEAMNSYYDLSPKESTRPIFFRQKEIPERDRLTEIVCPGKVDFYEFHNLVAFIAAWDENNRYRVYGIAENPYAPADSYYVCLSRENDFEDTLIGVTDGGQHFSIYLPGSFIEGGNMAPGDNPLTVVGWKSLLEQL